MMETLIEKSIHFFFWFRQLQHYVCVCVCESREYKCNEKGLGPDETET